MRRSAPVLGRSRLPPAPTRWILSTLLLLWMPLRPRTGRAPLTARSKSRRRRQETLAFFCFSEEMNESRDHDSYKIGFLNGPLNRYHRAAMPTRAALHFLQMPVSLGYSFRPLLRRTAHRHPTVAINSHVKNAKDTLPNQTFLCSYIQPSPANVRWSKVMRKRQLTLIYCPVRWLGFTLIKDNDFTNVRVAGASPMAIGAVGGNLGYLDGSVSWKPIGEMKPYRGSRFWDRDGCFAVW